MFRHKNPIRPLSKFRGLPVIDDVDAGDAITDVTRATTNNIATLHARNVLGSGFSSLAEL
jgi:hypothetical protein